VAAARGGYTEAGIKVKWKRRKNGVAEQETKENGRREQKKRRGCGLGASKAM